MLQLVVMMMLLLLLVVVVALLVLLLLLLLFMCMLLLLLSLLVLSSPRLLARAVLQPTTIVRVERLVTFRFGTTVTRLCSLWRLLGCPQPTATAVVARRSLLCLKVLVLQAVILV